MIDKEFKLYCNNETVNDASIHIEPLIYNNIVFTSTFSLRSFAASCFYYNTINGKWQSDG